ncbi:hypothetical protein [Isoptericola sp. AK164]|uniref:hypothetical protein n=1 Tax=Isoptericola sp. AK164 TaxID=3024246 RepID=UPI00241861F7|nr:hypothetical protein [Isoptericola sp. AK164]
MSKHPVDERLARLAPTGSPDPERFAAARAELEVAVTDPHGPTAARSAPTTPGTSGASHRLDLDEDQIDVVTPLDTVQQARRRRGRRWTLAAAVAGVVAVTGTAVVLSPVGPDVAPAWLSSPEQSCADQVPEIADLEELTGDIVWRTIARSSAGADVEIVTDPESRVAGVCLTSHDDGTVTTGYWTLPGDTPDADEVRPQGQVTERGIFVWGFAGQDVTSVDVEARWRDRDRGAVIEAFLDDGTWWAHDVEAEEIPEDAEIQVHATLDDGTTTTVSLDDAWPGADSWNPLAEARRAECRSVRDWETGERVSPVLEDRRGDLGLALYADVDSRTMSACIQEADPPYEKLSFTSASEASLNPADNEAWAVSAGGSGPHQIAVGVAGDDVESVEVTTGTGDVLEANVSNGYWAVWAPDSSSSGSVDPADLWQDATIQWQLTDGSRSLTGPLFP